MIGTFKNRNAALAACGLLICLSGCASIRNCKYELTQRAYTACAWSDYDCDRRYCVISPYSSDYQYGWKSGFYSVITGGECRPPVVPPKKYWHPPLLCGCNECGCEEWYEGFRCGVHAAQHQPDYHFIKPCWNTACDNLVSGQTCQSCQSCDAGPSLETNHGIQLLGIEPLEPDSDPMSPTEAYEADIHTPADGSTELTPQLSPAESSGTGQ